MSKYIGRKESYTKIGIARLVCVICGKRKAEYQWNCCANGNRNMPICWRCDIRLNKAFLRLVKSASRKKIESLLKAYEVKVRAVKR